MTVNDLWARKAAQTPRGFAAAPRMSRRFVIAFVCAAVATAPRADAADKYALLVGVTKYQHANLNDPPLEYPEADAEAIGALLESSGYKIDRLLGRSATRAAVLSALEKVGREGSSDGVVIVGLFGHGVQFADNAYFCTHDTRIRIVKDGSGNTLRTASGNPMQEPDPESIVSMREILDAMAISGAGGKLLLADCCRKDPNTARGRAFGSELKVSDLPSGMVAMFACSADERAFEHSDWRHGAFTKAVLDACASKHNVATAAGLFEDVEQGVRRLVSEKVGSTARQNVHILMNGNVILGLTVPQGSRRRPPPLRVPFTSAQATTRRMEWAEYLAQPADFTNSIGLRMILVPPGRFVMGSPDTADANRMAAHDVEITRPFYVDKLEVTVGDFRRFVDATGYRTTAERDDSGQNRGWNSAQQRFRHEKGFTWRHTGWDQADDHPVVNVSWEDATAFTRWLSAQEGRTYRLLTEAEWEYCCRAGTSTKYSVGDDPSALARVGNVLDKAGMRVFSRDSEFSRESANDAISGEDGFVFTMAGGSLPVNGLGLADFHGNVCEWCNDLYAEDYGGKVRENPQGAVSGEERCARGGRFDTGRYLAQSFARNKGNPRMSDMILGFRVALDVRE